MDGSLSTWLQYEASSLCSTSIGLTSTPEGISSIDANVSRASANCFLDLAI